jgi:hypothetical protein
MPPPPRWATLQSPPSTVRALRHCCDTTLETILGADGALPDVGPRGAIFLSRVLAAGVRGGAPATIQAAKRACAVAASDATPVFRRSLGRCIHSYARRPRAAVGRNHLGFAIVEI